MSVHGTHANLYGYDVWVHRTCATQNSHHVFAHATQYCPNICARETCAPCAPCAPRTATCLCTHANHLVLFISSTERVMP